VAKRRDGSGETWASVGGRGFKLDATSSLARAEWLAVAETQGMAAGARILSAVEIDFADIEALFGDRIETRRSVRFDPATGRTEATRERRLGAIRLASGPDSAADPGEIEAALLEGVRAHGLGLLPWSDAAQALRTRAAYGGYAALSDEALIESLDEWLPPLLAGKRRLDAVAAEGLTQALQNLLGWEGQRTLDRLAPARLETPAGSSHAIDYAAEGGPRVELRVQSLFGLSEHPTIGNGVPLVLSLTSPAGRPIQTTRDLPGFWAGSWVAVAKEMRGRYPRHPWPDDPANASATLRTKNADARRAAAR
jgi:ATP-dependent helicase HrpB